MRAELESLTSIIRVFRDGLGYGDPYEFSATIRWISPTRVEVLGIQRAPKPSEWRAITECLHSHGGEELLISRSTADGIKEHVFDLRRKRRS